MGDIASAATPVAIVFGSVETVFAVILAVVCIRIGSGVRQIPYSLTAYLIIVCCLIDLASLIFAFNQEDYTSGVVFTAQLLGDSLAYLLVHRAASNGFNRGTFSIWRAVLSSLMSFMSSIFVTDQPECQALFLSVMAVRISWIFAPYADTRCTGGKSKNSLDEWGLLLNRWPSSYSMRMFVSYPGDDEYDSENPMESNRGVGNLESLLSSSNSEVLPSASCNNSDSTSGDSVDSFPLVRSPSVIGRVQFVTREGMATGAVSAQMVSRPADDAAGPRPDEPMQLAQRLPESVRMIAHKEVLTTGGVPLVVYVLQTDRNGIVVHRYGEFRALCTRVVSKFYHECGAEPPPFPGRRVFRKFIPQSMGGMAQGAGADREFIQNRANGLGDWIQQVLDFVRNHSDSDVPVLALLDFLKPIVHYSSDSNLEQVIRSAVIIFSDTVLNPIAPPSPYV